MNDFPSPVPFDGWCLPFVLWHCFLFYFILHVTRCVTTFGIVVYPAPPPSVRPFRMFTYLFSFSWQIGFRVTCPTAKIVFAQCIWIIVVPCYCSSEIMRYFCRLWVFSGVNKLLEVGQRDLRRIRFNVLIGRDMCSELLIVFIGN